MTVIFMCRCVVFFVFLVILMTRVRDLTTDRLQISGPALFSRTD